MAEIEEEDFMYDYEESDDEEDEDEEGDFVSDGLLREDSVPSGSKLKAEWQTLSPDQLSKKMFEIVDDVNAVFQLPTPHVRILLTACKWDKEKLMERYYAGDQEALFREAHLIHPKKRNPNPVIVVRAQSTSTCGAAASSKQEYICDICMMSYSTDHMMGLECGHLFCRPCWNNYLTVMVMSQGRAQTLSCPATSCDIVVDEATVLELLTDGEVRKKYQYLITNSFVQDHPLLKWCPSPGCCNALLASNNVEHEPVSCSCGHSFCFKCSRDPHEPILCTYLSKWLKKCDDDSETSNWIHVNTKECPKCSATIEKNGGCNHMICCNNSCKAEFCWVCLGPWEPHGTSWYNCNRYNESDAKSARDAQMGSRAALERYLFYCNRYMNHLRSSKMEAKLYEMVHEKMKELQQLGMSWVEIQFMKKAVDVLCLCRQTLMYTYVFAYYLKKNNHMLIFEDNQSDLEIATELLSEYLEREITSVSLDQLKIQVQDKSKYCEARRKVLLEHVYEGYDQDFWDFTEL
ncbi:PREDICTED: E3 ubiquitin-protein ligase arih1-like [Amphimedon queenslandica]|uniref:RBR-type E3 ubiquitin transferase n=1 Tax=Amphimedon queenslandica TaxID=400682 RepID=A0A1X7VRV0_AMPQE|nr:PREDICTED: E3 ubiquitin-protein ligase arih1-like [Amphimedon queenslandica]|eukprot:XP_003382988.1 PREDICTED: E3 ubiquitin-protein ligase arih1-like [Amphimedon queenslandica]